MLIDYLPNFMKDVEEMAIIMNASEPEIENINDNIDGILADLFVIGCSQEATKRYERIVQIIPKLTDSLEKRQYDILAIYNQTLPFTLESLQEKLNAICDKDGYTIEMIYEKFILNVQLILSKKHLELTVRNLLEWIVPVNLIINLTIDYNKWKDLKKYRWKDLKKYRWFDIKESKDIKNGILDII